MSEPDWEEWEFEGQYESEEEEPAGRQPSPRAFASVQHGASLTDGHPEWHIIADCNHCGRQILRLTNVSMEQNLQHSPTNYRLATYRQAPPEYMCRGTVVCKSCAETKQASMGDIAQYTNWVDEVHSWLGDCPELEERCYEG